MASVTAIEVHSYVLFQKGHTVHRWADLLESRFTTAAIAFAPRNKRANKSPSNAAWPVGSLKAGISGEVTHVAGTNILSVTISSKAPYSTYVLGRTNGPIYPESVDRFHLPPNPGYGYRWPKSVGGQTAQNFLADAARLTARSHSSIRGFDRVLRYGGGYLNL